MPTQDQYESYDKQVREQKLDILSSILLQADIQKFKDIGDASRIAMILQVIKHQRKITYMDISNFENRLMQVYEVWPTGSAWATWQETRPGQK